MTGLTTRASSKVNGRVIASARVSAVGQALVTAITTAGLVPLLYASGLSLATAIAAWIAIVLTSPIAYGFVRLHHRFGAAPWGLILASGPGGVWVFGASFLGRPTRLLATLPGATTQESHREWPRGRMITVTCPDGQRYRFESPRGWR